MLKNQLKSLKYTVNSEERSLHSPKEKENLQGIIWSAKKWHYQRWSTNVSHAMKGEELCS